jgi:hypothetical protein
VCVYGQFFFSLPLLCFFLKKKEKKDFLKKKDLSINGKSSEKSEFNSCGQPS